MQLLRVCALLLTITQSLFSPFHEYMQHRERHAKGSKNRERERDERNGERTIFHFPIYFCAINRERKSEKYIFEAFTLDMFCKDRFHIVLFIVERFQKKKKKRGLVLLMRDTGMYGNGIRRTRSNEAENIK